MANFLTWRLSSLLLMSSLIAGCAGSSLSYTPPSDHEVVTEKVISAPFEITWDRYVAELSKSFFVINNISKDSRIINVSFSTDKPSRYIDCGTSFRTSKHPRTGEEQFRYAVADGSTYNAGQNGTNVLWTFNRDTNLEGRINIYMAPEGAQTLIRVNSKYIWTVRINGTSNLGQPSQPSSDTIDFSSTSPGGDEELQCRSNGSLEAQLLDLVGSTT